MYELRVSYTKPGNSEEYTFYIKAPFTRWFTEDGFFQSKPFQQWLATEIPPIGKADPKNVVKGEKVVKQVTAANAGAAMQDIAASTAQGTRNRKAR